MNAAPVGAVAAALKKILIDGKQTAGTLGGCRGWMQTKLFR